MQNIINRIEQNINGTAENSSFFNPFQPNHISANAIINNNVVKIILITFSISAIRLSRKQLFLICEINLIVLWKE